MTKKNMTLLLLLGAGAGLGAVYYFKKRKDDEIQAQAVAKAVAPAAPAPIKYGVSPAPFLAKSIKPAGILPPHLKKLLKAKVHPIAKHVQAQPQMQGNYFSLG